MDHFVTGIQQDKDVLLAILDDVLHNVKSQSNVGCCMGSNCEFGGAG